MDSSQSESRKPTPLTNIIVRPGDKPLGDPQQILTVFRKDQNYYVEVNMRREFKTGPEHDVHEFLPLAFRVDEFKRTFPRDEHREVMDKLDKKVAEFEKDKMGGEATPTIWVRRLSGLLHHIFGCLPTDVGHLSSYPAESPQAKHPKRHSYIDGDVNDSKTYKRASQQSMIPLRTAIRESDYRVAPEERSYTGASPDTASNILVSSYSNGVPPFERRTAQPKLRAQSPAIKPLLQYSLSGYTLACNLPPAHPADASITPEDTVLWIESL